MPFALFHLLSALGAFEMLVPVNFSGCSPPLIGWRRERDEQRPNHIVLCIFSRRIGYEATTAKI